MLTKRAKAAAGSGAGAGSSSSLDGRSCDDARFEVLARILIQRSELFRRLRAHLPNVRSRILLGGASGAQHVLHASNGK